MPDLFNPQLLKLKELIGGFGGYGGGTPGINGNSGEPNLSSNMPPGSPVMNLGGPYKDPEDKSDFPSPISNQGNQGNQEEGNDDIETLINKLYTPEHAIADKFSTVWEQMPAREKPGMLKKITAMIAGAGTGDPSAGDYVLNNDYNQKMGDWTNKLKMLQPALTDERMSNANERLRATSVGSQRIQNRRADIAQGQLDRQIAEGKAKGDIAQKKLELERFKVDHPSHEYIKDQATGKVMAVNPKNPSEPPIDTGLTFDNFSELEKAQWRIREAATTRTVNTTGTTTTTTVDPDKAGEAPNDEKIRRYNSAQEVYNKNPQWQKFIELGDPGTNSFKILDDAPPELVDFIYKGNKDISLDGTTPGKTVTSNTSRTSTSSKGGTPPKSKIPVNTRVKDPKTGQTGTYKGTAEEAKKAGYEVIR